MDIARQRINQWRLDNLETETLDLSNLGLNELPKLPSELKRLNCSGNNLTIIKELPESLEYINCNKNKIYLIEEFPLNCKYIDCSYNNLKSLPELPMDCTYLDISHNEFKRIPILPDTIEYLNYFNNYIDNKIYDELVVMPNIKNINGARISFVDPEDDMNTYSYSQIPSPKIHISSCIYKNTVQDVQDYLAKSNDNIVTGSNTFYNCCKRSIVTNVRETTKFLKSDYNLTPCINRWITNNDLRKLKNKSFVIYKFIDSDIKINNVNVAYIIPYTMDDYAGMD
jgi:hypothetical protein